MHRELWTILKYYLRGRTPFWLSSPKKIRGILLPNHRILAVVRPEDQFEAAELFHNTDIEYLVSRYFV